MNGKAAITFHALKSPDALRSEIAYFARELTRTTSADRRRRHHRAIQIREAALTIALTRTVTDTGVLR
jgi:hypothetical protein